MRMVNGDPDREAVRAMLWWKLTDDRMRKGQKTLSLFCGLEKLAKISTGISAEDPDQEFLFAVEGCGFSVNVSDGPFVEKFGHDTSENGEPTLRRGFADLGALVHMVEDEILDIVAGKQERVASQNREREQEERAWLRRAEAVRKIFDDFVAAQG